MKPLKEDDKFTDDLITIEQAAEMLKLSVSQIRKMCSAKTIPHLKIGGRVRFYRPELKKWVFQNRAA